MRFTGSLNSLIAMLRKHHQSQYLLPQKRAHSQGPPHPSFLTQTSGPSCLIILPYCSPGLPWTLSFASICKLNKSPSSLICLPQNFHPDLDLAYHIYIHTYIRTYAHTYTRPFPHARLHPRAPINQFIHQTLHQLCLCVRRERKGKKGLITSQR